MCDNVCTGNLSCSAGTCRCADPTPGTAVRLTNSIADESRPRLAWDGSSHVGVAYLNTSYPAVNARFTLLGTDGSVTTDIPLTDFSTSGQVSNGPVIAWGGSEYGLAWVQRDNVGRTSVMFRRVSAAGAAIAPAVQIGIGDDAAEAPYTNYHTGLGIAWSASYGGYALSYRDDLNVSYLVFRRIGATGEAPEPQTKIALKGSYVQDFPMAAGPAGTWGVVGPDVSLSLFDANGAHTIPTALLNAGVQPLLVHDGKTWLTAFLYEPSTENLGTYWVNRGASANSPSRLITASTTAEHLDASIAMVNGALAIAFTNSPSSQYKTGPYGFSVQRFAIPSSTGSTLTAIDRAVDVLASPSIPQRGDMQIIASGQYSLLAVWADNRSSTSRELYARPIDLHTCP